LHWAPEYRQVNIETLIELAVADRNLTQVEEYIVLDVLLVTVRLWLQTFPERADYDEYKAAAWSFTPLLGVRWLY